MTIYEIVRARLLGDAAIVALVVARVYPQRLPAKVTLPSIVLTRVSGIRAGHLRGVASLARPRVQVDCWAPNSDQAGALGALVRQRLESASFPYTDTTTSPETTVNVQTVFDEEHDLFDEDILGGSVRHSADYFVFHSTAGGSV